MLFYLYCTHFLHVSSSPVPSSTSDYKLPFVLASFHRLCVAHVPREMKISVVDTLFDHCSGYPLFSLSHNIWFVFCTAAHATRPYWHHLDFLFLSRYFNEMHAFLKTDCVSNVPFFSTFLSTFIWKHNLLASRVHLALQSPLFVLPHKFLPSYLLSAFLWKQLLWETYFSGAFKDTVKS